MTDDQLVAAFESLELAADQFSHAEHVRAAWWYLSHFSLPEALARFSSALRRFTAAKGAPDKYHETITVAYLLLIAERLDGPARKPWVEFATANADLLTRKPSVLARYYTDEVLASARARRTFVMPDRIV